jgi:hypothetical protein
MGGFTAIAIIAILNSADSDCSGGGGVGNTISGTQITCNCDCLPCQAHASAFTSACTSFDTFSDPNDFSTPGQFTLCIPAGNVSAANLDATCARGCFLQSAGDRIQ